MCFNKKNSLLYYEHCVICRAGRIAIVNAKLPYKMMPMLKFHFLFNKCAVAYCTFTVKIIYLQVSFI